jgi:hypothetical protein
MLHMNKPHSKYARLYSALTRINRDDAPSNRHYAEGLAHGLCIEMGFSFEANRRYCALASNLAGVTQ